MPIPQNIRNVQTLEQKVLAAAVLLGLAYDVPGDQQKTAVCQAVGVLQDASYEYWLALADAEPEVEKNDFASWAAKQGFHMAPIEAGLHHGQTPSVSDKILDVIERNLPDLAQVIVAAMRPKGTLTSEQIARMRAAREAERATAAANGEMATPPAGADSAFSCEHEADLGKPMSPHPELVQIGGVMAACKKCSGLFPAVRNEAGEWVEVDIKPVE